MADKPETNEPESVTAKITADEPGPVPVVLQLMALLEEPLRPRKAPRQHDHESERLIRNAFGVLSGGVD